MIKVNELRRGNYLFKNGEHVIVDGYERDTSNNDLITIDGSCEAYNIADFEPVPLTPDILEKCGFQVNDMEYNPYSRHMYMNVVEGTYLHINSSNGSCSIGHYESCVHVDNGTVTTTFYIQDVSYLHQLQNLYYSLTGHELTIQS